MQKRLWMAPAVALAVLAVLSFGACDDGGDGSDGDDPEAVPTEEYTPPRTVVVPDELAPQPERPDGAQEVDAEVLEPVDFNLNISVTDNAFVPNNLQLDQDDPVVIFITNEGQNQHTLRIAAYDGQYETDDDFATVEINRGDTDGLEVTGPVQALQLPGTYGFRCDIHPEEMYGQLTVVE